MQLIEPNIKMNRFPAWQPWSHTLIDDPAKDILFWNGRNCQFTVDWELDYEDSDYKFNLKINKGFVTDGGTVPKIIRGYIKPFGRGIIGWFPHDALYRNRFLPKTDCDIILSRLLYYMEFHYWTIKLVYTSLQLLGTRHYYAPKNDYPDPHLAFTLT